MVPWKIDTPPLGKTRENLPPSPGKSPSPSPDPGKNLYATRGHFLKTRFLYKKIHAQQSAPKPPYVGRMNVGRGDRGEGSPGRATRYHAGCQGSLNSAVQAVHICFFYIFVVETKEIITEMDRSEIDFQIMAFSKQHPDSWLSLDSTRNMSDDEALLALKRAAISLLP